MYLRHTFTVEPVYLICMKLSRYNSESSWGIILLITLLFTIFVLPVIDFRWQKPLSWITDTLIFLAAIASVARRKKMVITIALVALALEWISDLFNLWLLNSVSKGLNSIFFLLVVILLIKQVATSEHVDLKVILGSVIGYLLLGLLYAIVINYIMVHDPAAFQVTQVQTREVSGHSWYGESVYFTFVTLATLGYGDILPLKPYARSLAIFITVSGQLYIAIIIALLVGKFAAVRHGRRGSGF